MCFIDAIMLSLQLDYYGLLFALCRFIAAQFSPLHVFA